MHGHTYLYINLAIGSLLFGRATSISSSFEHSLSCSANPTLASGCRTNVGATMKDEIIECLCQNPGIYRSDHNYLPAICTSENTVISETIPNSLGEDVPEYPLSTLFNFQVTSLPLPTLHVDNNHSTHTSDSKADIHTCIRAENSYGWDTSRAGNIAIKTNTPNPNPGRMGAGSNIYEWECSELFKVDQARIRAMAMPLIRKSGQIIAGAQIQNCHNQQQQQENSELQLDHMKKVIGAWFICFFGGIVSTLEVDGWS